MADDTCSIEGCERKRFCRGWCEMHYARWRRTGSTESNRREHCTIAGCGRKHVAHGLCRAHYSRWYTGGDPLAELPIITHTDDETRFWSHVDKSADCWLWTAKLTHDGYGCFVTNKRWRPAHRVSYELAHGQIPSDMQIDHRCFIKACVRPSHLRLATPSQNGQHRSGPQSNSKSGVRGVHWVEASHAWRAKVVYRRKTIVVGFFDSIEEAEAAVIAKRNELFTHNDLDRVE